MRMSLHSFGSIHILKESQRTIGMTTCLKPIIFYEESAPLGDVFSNNFSFIELQVSLHICHSIGLRVAKIAAK